MLRDEINRAKNKYMSSKLVTFNKYKHNMFSWMSHGLLTSIRYKCKRLKQVTLTNFDSPEREASNINSKYYIENAFSHSKTNIF